MSTSMMISLLGARSSLVSLRLCEAATRQHASQTAGKILSRNLTSQTAASFRQKLCSSNSQGLFKNNNKLFSQIKRLISYGPKGHIYFPLFRNGKRMTFVRFASTDGNKQEEVRSIVLYIASVLVVMLGLTYAMVPAYKVFCRQFGLGGNTEYGRALNAERVELMEKIEERVIKVRFTADTAAAMQWKFKPQQAELRLVPGETALAFYSATNPTERPVIGISTYSVSPPAAALYFNKIQCFCFEEQILNPGEQVDLPVFFYIDPDYDKDVDLEFTDDITLSYTFFEAREGLNLPLPGFVTQQFESNEPAPAT